jgi:outer membrane protein, multidrug efflux system
MGCKTHARAALVLGVLAISGGCVPALPQGPVRAPDTDVPRSYGTARTERRASLVDWRELFGDEHLVALVEEALENNQELNIAVQESFIARFELMARRGEILPQLSVGARAGVERVGHSTSQGRSDEMAELDENLQDYSFGLSLSWELDIWNRLRNLGDAAASRYLATVHGRYFMATRLVAEIASLYYELMALDRQLEVVRSTIALQEDALDAVRLQFHAGRTTSLAVTRFEAALREMQAREYAIRQHLVETENRVNFLLGRFPQPIARASDRFFDLRPAALEPGLPSELLVNRPDVRAAELRLEAAQLSVSAARARFFPALSLDAAIGYQSFDILRLVETPGSLFFELFGNLVAPLLNRSGITAEYFSADAVQRQAVLEYERAILNAYLEVANELNRVENLRRSYEATEQRVEQLTQSVEIADRLFDAARAEYLEVLTARRELLDARVELIETKQRLMTAVAVLYQALGGGWHADSDELRRSEGVGEEQ